MANNDKENKIKKFTKEAIGKTLNQFNKEIGIADLVEVNKNQDRILNGILSQVNDENTEKTEKSNIITLDNSTDGIVELKEIQGDTNVNVSKIEEMPITHDIGDKEGNVFTLNEIPKGAISIGEIQGNTMVNCNKDDKKELVLMKDLSTQGDNNITLTEGVDGGKVDVALEGNTLVNVSKTKDNYITHEREEDTTGNHIALVDEGYIRPVLNGKTMVNVCDQKDPIAVTKSYTVENSGNHIPLQSEYDGKCRPVITGNTLVNLIDKNIRDKDISTAPNISSKFNYKYQLKTNTTYTLFYTLKDIVLPTDGANNVVHISIDQGWMRYGETRNSDGCYKFVFTTGDDTSNCVSVVAFYANDTTGGSGTISDIILLEGDYTDKPISDYFEGLQSSFEDNKVPENIINMTGTFRVNNSNVVNPTLTLSTNLKANTVYTRVYHVSGLVEGNNIAKPDMWDMVLGDTNNQYPAYSLRNGWRVDTFMNLYEGRGYQIIVDNNWRFNNTNEERGFTVDKFFIIEGDWSNYDFSDYDPTKSGKYRVDYKVTGKNKFDINTTTITGLISSDGSITTANDWRIHDYMDIKPNTEYILSEDSDNYKQFYVAIYDKDKNFVSKFILEGGSTLTFTTPLNSYFYRMGYSVKVLNNAVNRKRTQLEEGAEATEYEPYKESTKTLYLNSPLLEGDTIGQYGNNIAHVHRYGKVVLDGSEAWKISSINDRFPGQYLCYLVYPNVSFVHDTEMSPIMCDKFKVVSPGNTNLSNVSPDSISVSGIESNLSEKAFRLSISESKLSSLDLAGFRKYLLANPITVVYKLVSPQYEVISTNDKLLTDSYVNGHLDFESAVPVEKVVFQRPAIPLKYGYSGVKYTLQFESDNTGWSKIALENSLIYEGIVTKGINTFEGVFGDQGKLTCNLYFNGIGFNASNIVVTPAIEQDFDYFSGLSSTFENNLVPENILGEKVKNTAYKVEYSLTKNIKPNTTYTIYLKGSNMLYCGFQKDSNWVKYRTPYQGVSIITTDDNVDINKFSIHAVSNNLTVDTCILIEGDYSSFGLTNYEPTKVGKYKIDYNVVGKNKIGNLTHLRSWQADYELLSDGGIKVTPTTTSGVSFVVFRSDSKVYKGKTYRFNGNPTNKSMYNQGGLWKTNTTSWVYSGTNPIDETQSFDVCIYVNNSSLTNEVIVYPQLEEGTEATAYEPYKESTKTLYLNSPLLEGDTIEEKEDGIYHVHRYSKSVLDGSLFAISDSDKNGIHRYYSTKYQASKYDIEVKPIYCDRLPVSISCEIDGCITFGGEGLVEYATTKSMSEAQEWLQQNPTTVVYPSVAPTYELIEQSNLAISSYTNGHLDLPSAVPVSKVNFLHFEEELTYLYPSTSYTVQFTSDKAITIDITLGGTQLLAQNIVKGLNRISITTPETLVDNKLIINGTGAKINKVVVTDTNREFKYFEGMKSVGECEELEVKSGNKNLFDEKYLLGGQVVTFNGKKCYRYLDNKDNFKLAIDFKPNTRYTLTLKCYREDGDSNKIINGRIKYTDGTYTMIYGLELNTRIVISDEGKTIESINGNWNWDSVVYIDLESTQLEEGDTATDYIPHTSNTQTLTHEPLRSVGDIKDKYVLIDGKWYIERNCGVRAYQEGDIDNYITDKINTVYPLSSPTYEPIDYNPFTVYSDITHISNNSTIPANMIIKNTGYNCLLKPNTTYTVSSNLGLNTVTTPSVLSEDCLRFYDTDTSNVTTMKNVLILEGDWTTGKPIPSHFSGIESAFEQEYDEAVGKYKVKIRVQNEDASKENYIEFYINEPLRGIGDVKDRVYVKNDKVVVERNCGSVTFDGSEDEGWAKFGEDSFTNITRYSIRLGGEKADGYVLSDKFSKKDYRLNEEFIFIGGSSFAIFGISKTKIPSQNTMYLRQWLQQNPTTVVYQLAEPTYEEVEYSSNRLILDTFNNESFNNSTLFLDTNISPKLSFKPLWEELVYVKNSTKYYIQFNAVGSGEVVINLGGTELTTEIVEGYNCIPITTPSESTNLMTIIGQGITISEVVVSEVICGGYYKGLQSCFEEHMENGKYRVLLRGIALDGSKVNGIKLYINEPLRGIGDVKDRLCIKNGKLMVERKCGEAIFDGSNYIQSMDTSIDTKKRWLIYQDSSIKDVSDSQVTTINDKYCDISANDTWYNKEGISQNSMQHAIHIYLERYSDGSDESKQALISELQQNPVTVVYQLAEQTYEEATNEYGLPIVFEGYENGIVYIDSAVTPTTHIKYTSNNQLATNLSEAEEQNISTQEDINMNVVTYMMDIDMILTEMEMSNDISVMAVRRDNSNENMLDRMSKEDKKVYQDNTVVMLEKMITANVLEKEDIEGRIDMYYDKNRISKEQYKYLKSLL